MDSTQAVAASEVGWPFWLSIGSFVVSVLAVGFSVIFGLRTGNRAKEANRIAEEAKKLVEESIDFEKKKHQVAIKPHLVARIAPNPDDRITNIYGDSALIQNIGPGG